MMKKSLEKCIGGKCFSQGLLSLVGDEEPALSYKPELSDKTHKWYFIDTAKNIKETETGVVVFERVKDLNQEVFSDEFTRTAMISGTDPAEIELVPGIYKVSILLTDTDKLVIPKEERCTGGLFSTCVTFDESVLDKQLSGQVSWDKPEYYVEVTPDQLYGADEMTIYVLSFNIEGVPQKAHLRVMEDTQTMAQMGNLSQVYRNYLEPSYG